jgi:hypothetical protein
LGAEPHISDAKVKTDRPMISSFFASKAVGKRAGWHQQRCEAQHIGRATHSMPAKLAPSERAIAGSETETMLASSCNMKDDADVQMSTSSAWFAES